MVESPLSGPQSWENEGNNMANKPPFFQSSLSPTNERGALGKTKPRNTISGQKKSILAETWLRLSRGGSAGFLPLLLCLFLSWLYTSSRQVSALQPPSHWCWCCCLGSLIQWKTDSQALKNSGPTLTGSGFVLWRVVAKFTLKLFWIMKCSFLVCYCSPLGKKHERKPQGSLHPCCLSSVPLQEQKGNRKSQRSKRELHLSVLTLKSLGNMVLFPSALLGLKETVTILGTNRYEIQKHFGLPRTAI